jgi:YegS/Rv2252/BmrU family lipid kinase
MQPSPDTPGTSTNQHDTSALDTPAETDTQRVFVILNPVAGSSAADEVRRALEQYFASTNRTCDYYETTGDEQLEDVVCEAMQHNFAMVVAAGGDGTVSGVASGLVRHDVPLGIIPIGTANVLAQELGIPLDIDAACRLLSEQPTVAHIDAMKVGNRHFFLQIGIGLDSLMIRDTDRGLKRRFGRLAYIWTGLKWLVGYQPVRFSLMIDGKQRRPRAAQVLIANGGTLGIPQFRWGPDIYPDDGSLNVCLIYARTLFDYLGIAWHMLTHRQKRSRKIRYYTAHDSIIVNADDYLPVQADGEIIDEVPLHIEIIPGAVHIIVPGDTIPTGQPAPDEREPNNPELKEL